MLVTGAFGQVGTRCTQILLDRGRTVIALDLRTEKSEATAAELASGRGRGTLIPAYVDLLDADAIDTLIGTHQPGAIVHLAAVLAPLSYRNPGLARTVNVGGTENLGGPLAALPEAPLFLLASSASVYGSVNPYRQSGAHHRPNRGQSDRSVRPGQGARRSGDPRQRTAVRDPADWRRISPDTQSSVSGDHLVLMRATAGRQPDALGGHPRRGTGLRQRGRPRGDDRGQDAGDRAATRPTCTCTAPSRTTS